MSASPAVLTVSPTSSTYYCYTVTDSGAGTPAASATSATDLVTVSSIVSVASRTISSINCGTSCGSSNNLTGSPYAQTNVDTEYWWSASLIDSGGLTDLGTVTVYVYKTGGATKGSFDHQRSYEFEWVNNDVVGPGSTGTCNTTGGCWYELNAGGWVASSFTYLLSADSSHTTLGSATSGTWTFAAKLSKLAQYTLSGSSFTDWYFEVDVTNSGATSSALRNGFLDVNLYVSIVTAPSAVNYGTIAAGAANATAQGNPYQVTYTANANVYLQLAGTGNPTNEYGNSIPLSNIYVGKSSSASNNDGIQLTTTLTNLYSSLPVAQNQIENTYWFATTPNPFTPGTYSFQYVVNIAFQNYAT
jgi:hypothetical protein